MSSLSPEPAAGYGPRPATVQEVARDEEDAMADEADDRWSWSVGPHGDRVRVREMKLGGNVYLEAYDPELGNTRRKSLKFRVRDEDGDLLKEAVEEAQATAKATLALRIQGEMPWEMEAEEEETGPTTAGELFEVFRQRELPSLSERRRKRVKRDLDLLESFLGPDFEMHRFDLQEWNALKRQRASGEIDAHGNRVHDPDKREEVAAATVAHTLKVLRQVCRYGRQVRREDGEKLLPGDPTEGFDLPSEPDPTRPVADDELYRTLLEAAGKVRTVSGPKRKLVRAPLRELLVLAAGTGRRIGAIVRLRWSDWLPEEGTYGFLRWRADADKLGREWKAPVPPEVREALEALRRERPGVGDAWIFPAPASDGHLRVTLANKWLRRAEEKAEIKHVKGFGFHAFRRMWATKRKHLPLKDVAAAGGWKGTQTLQTVYQHPDPDTLEEVVMGGRDLRLGPQGGARKAAGGDEG